MLCILFVTNHKTLFVKIIILTSNYPRKKSPNDGIFIHQQVKALQQLGAECHVLVVHNWFPPLGLHKYHRYWRDGYELKADYLDSFEGIPIHHVPAFVRMPSRFFPQTEYDRAVIALSKYITSSRQLRDADIIYGHFLTSMGYIAARLKDMLNMTVATIARGDDVHAWPETNPDLRNHLKFVFSKSDILLANSQRLAQDTQHWMEPGSKRSVSTVYNGIDTTFFRPAASSEERLQIVKQFNLPFDDKILVCVARPVVLKGWEELLTAFSEFVVTHTGWKLLMVAPVLNYHDEIDLMQKGRELSITQSLIFIPGLKPPQLALLLRACHAFVLPSYNEGMANALLEAMASGLPCIATNVGGHAEVIDNWSNGILIEPRSVTEIKNALTLLAEDDKLCAAMGIRARQRMEELGNYLQNGKKLLDIFEQNLRTTRSSTHS